MKNTVLYLVSTATVVAASNTSNKNKGGALPLHPRFRSHLKCPYADKWLSKGPEQAALELGLDSNGRKLQQPMPETQGSCTYTNAFTGSPTCLQFSGSSWTESDMNTRCTTENGTFSTNGCSTTTDGFGGWCTKMIGEDKHEYTAMMLSPMADCSGSKMACSSFMGGVFVADGECLDTTESESMPFGGGGPPPGVDTTSGSWPGASSTEGGDLANKCLLAPGAIGAAHQAGFSKGYSNSCPGTPAQESPYMWPLKWAADFESHSMAFGSDDVVYKSKGRTYYGLDHNWKRSDTTYQEGLLRTVGQGPCEDIDEDFAEQGFLGCRYNNTDGTMSTMIHRENLMYFISWKEDETNPVQVGERDASKIEECTMLNMAVVGNIRPDWFMDKRGDDTDVQYLGNQHVYYADGQIPKLVKQWRKKDFASQYFVMSMTGNPPNMLEQDPEAPVEDNMHWPLILNVPGEGFGDDFLQVYKDHTLLTDDDDDLFKLIENYQAIGGECIDLRAEGGSDVGPPVLEEGEEIPSNLVVDPLSWVSNEITFSPIWVPTVTLMDKKEPASMESVGSDSVVDDLGVGKEITEASDRVTVESCYDEETKMMDMSIHYHEIEPGMDGLLPWMALGYRSSELCAMTPPDGGVTPIITITQESKDVAPQAHKTQLFPEAKAFSQMAFDSMNSLMVSLSDVDGYMDVSIDAPMASTSAIQIARSFEADDTVSLHFKQAVETPEQMNLMFAIGMQSQLGIHTTRGCFEIQPTPCKREQVVQDTESIEFDMGSMEQEKEDEVDVNTDKSMSSASVTIVGGTAFMLSGIVAMLVVGL